MKPRPVDVLKFPDLYISCLLLSLVLTGCGNVFPPSPLAKSPNVAPAIHTPKVADESAVGNGGNEIIAAFFHRAQNEMSTFCWERLGPAEASRFQESLTRGKLTVVGAIPYFLSTQPQTDFYYDANRLKKAEPFLLFLENSRGEECVQRVVFDGKLMDWVLEIDTFRWEELRKRFDSVPSPLNSLLELAARKGIIESVLPLPPPQIEYTRFSSPRFFRSLFPSEPDSAVLAKIELIMIYRLVPWIREREFPQLDARETEEILSLLQSKAISIKEFPPRMLPESTPSLTETYFDPMFDDLGKVIDARVVRDPLTKEPFIQFDSRVWSSFFLRGEIVTESMLVQLFHEVLRYAYLSGRITKSDDNYAISSSFRIKDRL